MQADWRCLTQKVGAEMVGTFALVFVGCGAVMTEALHPGAVGPVGIALAFGLVIAVMVYAVGHVSGAHFNPAVTVAFAARGVFPWREVGPYIAGQCAAAVGAAFLLRGLLGPAGHIGATVPAGGLAQAAGIEIVLTAFLMFVITAVATDSRAMGQMAGIAIGGTVALASLMGGPLSGASMNPARSLGPALAAGMLAPLWLYVVAPVAGALLGTFVYRLVRCAPPESASAGGCC